MLGALHLLVACPEFTPVQYESPEPVNESCRAVCCLEFESPCATTAVAACGGCDDRCRGACADGAPLLSCMQASNSRFECPSQGVVSPPAGVCRAEFDAYQGRAANCNNGGGLVGYTRPLGSGGPH